MTVTYQQGMTTLQRLRSDGAQKILVQHVTVEDGGQAIVAGKVKAGGSAASARDSGGVVPEMSDEPHVPTWKAGLERARAAKRCGARTSGGRMRLHSARYAQRPLSAARGQEHGPAHA
jgi:hypothetical protein